MLKTIFRTAAAAAIIAFPLAACGGGSSTGGSDDISAADVTVHALDALKFDDSEYTAPAGDVTIGYINDGSLQHDLLIDGHPGFKLTVNNKGQTKAGKTNLTPGTYTIYCDIPTHREAGMQATLIITNAPPSSASASASASGN